MSDQSPQVEQKTTAQTPSKNESSQAPRPRRTRPQLSRPMMRRKLSLNSLQAQKVVDRSFSRVSSSLFSTDVILQIIADPEHVGRTEEVIAGMMDKVSDDLSLMIEQTSKNMSDNGIADLPEYTNPKLYDIEIISPQVAAFANLLVRLDVLTAQIDALWFNGVYTNQQRSKGTFEWQQRLIRLAGRIIGIEKEARMVAYKKGKNEEVDKNAPVIEIEAVEGEEIIAISSEEYEAAEAEAKAKA